MRNSSRASFTGTAQRVAGRTGAPAEGLLAGAAVGAAQDLSY